MRYRCLNKPLKTGGCRSHDIVQTDAALACARQLGGDEEGRVGESRSPFLSAARTKGSGTAAATATLAKD